MCQTTVSQFVSERASRQVQELQMSVLLVARLHLEATIDLCEKLAQTLMTDDWRLVTPTNNKQYVSRLMALQPGRLMAGKAQDNKSTGGHSCETTVMTVFQTVSRSGSPKSRSSP